MEPSQSILAALGSGLVLLALFGALMYFGTRSL